MALNGAQRIKVCFAHKSFNVVDINIDININITSGSSFDICCDGLKSSSKSQ